IYLNEVPLSAEAAARQLAGIAADDAQTEVQLRADAQVPYGRVVEVLGLAQKAGLSRIGFVADPRPPAVGLPASP
ncbi:hypothetical protein KXX11_004458, partial [Aspergillus fumigatus]